MGLIEKGMLDKDRIHPKEGARINFTLYLYWERRKIRGFSGRLNL
jgi:hypothetical protein